ncbi:MAG: serine/threonine-protein kinase [Aquabacterium sp.]
MSADDPGYEKTQLLPRRDREVALPRGAVVQGLVIDGVVGSGGFGIVYRVRDPAGTRVAALKEYLPSTLAQREPDGRVVPRSRADEANFQLGMRSFVKEAQLLASLDHPALLRVWRFWPDNGTAYMLMPYYQGVTLQRWLEALGAPPREDWLRHLARELIDALAILHSRDILHRDIAPDNILLLPGDERIEPMRQLPRPLLLDFGSARQVIAEATQNLTAFMKGGYTPMEQYGADMPQGPWTDVYSLCAVLYAAVSGKPPPSAVARVVNDRMVPATEVGRGRYAQSLLSAIDAGLALRPIDRPQTLAELRSRLDEEFAPTMLIMRPKPTASSRSSEAGSAAAHGAPSRPTPRPPAAAPSTWAPAARSSRQPVEPEPELPEEPTPSPLRNWLLAGGLVVLILLAAAGVWFGLI